MSADNYYLIIAADDGRFTAVNCSASCTYEWQVDPELIASAPLAPNGYEWFDHQDPAASVGMFATVEQAVAYAMEQYAEYGVQLHPKVKALVAELEAAKAANGWQDPENPRHLLLNEDQYAELEQLLAVPANAPHLRALVTF